MTVAVTGATGYVGRVLVERLLANGADVRALVRDPRIALPATVERAVVDLAEPRGLEQALRGVDGVVHCAAEQRSPSRERHRVVNAAGTAAVLGAAREAGVRRVVHLSSIAVYPRRDGRAPLGPDDPMDPFPELRDAYAWSKIAAERWVVLYRRTEGLDVVTLRLGIVYGREKDFVARIWRRLPGRRVAVAGSPGMLLPLVHVDDAAEAAWRALEVRRAAAPVLNVVGPETPTQSAYLAQRAAHGREDLAPVYVSLAACRVLARRHAASYARRPSSRTSRAYALAWSAQAARYDLRATERTLGWVPRIGLEDGLRGPAARDAVAIAAVG
jgi:nucleoside-diphosphate-sugar epimerase